jgi:hypothetical protein
MMPLKMVLGRLLTVLISIFLIQSVQIIFVADSVNILMTNDRK